MRRTRLTVALVILLAIALLLLLLPFSWIRPPGIGPARTIADVEVSLGAFHAEFGDYPPSDSLHMAAHPYGFQNLAFYLCGPEGKGWGGPAGGAMPFGGKSTSSVGPFYAGDPDHPEAILDAFQPSMPILYFRAEPTEDPVFDASDNPLDPTGRKGFASQEHFERLVRRANGQWVRNDYLLISAGTDRRFGYMVEDEAAGSLRPAQPEEKEKAWCDDIVNFTY